MRNIDEKVTFLRHSRAVYHFFSKSSRRPVNSNNLVLTLFSLVLRFAFTKTVREQSGVRLH